MIVGVTDESSEEEELAISSADLEKYLADGGSFREEIREQFYDDDDDDDSVEEEQKETKEVTACRSRRRPTHRRVRGSIRRGQTNQSVIRRV